MFMYLYNIDLKWNNIYNKNRCGNKTNKKIFSDENVYVFI